MEIGQIAKDKRESILAYVRHLSERPEYWRGDLDSDHVSLEYETRMAGSSPDFKIGFVPRLESIKDWRNMPTMIHEVVGQILRLDHDFGRIHLDGPDVDSVYEIIRQRVEEYRKVKFESDLESF
jgi:hypothetical protein